LGTLILNGLLAGVLLHGEQEPDDGKSQRAYEQL
jgi:hypothetical protein